MAEIEVGDMVKFDEGHIGGQKKRKALGVVLFIHPNGQMRFKVRVIGYNMTPMLFREQDLEKVANDALDHLERG